MVQPIVNYAPKKCRFCKGKSFDFWRGEEFHQTCKVCKGEGTLLVAQPAQKCPFCKGKAAYFWHDGDYYYKCKVCKGAGWAQARRPQRKK
jgi:DnaJ-class molecular chaperone